MSTTIKTTAAALTLAVASGPAFALEADQRMGVIEGVDPDERQLVLDIAAGSAVDYETYIVEDNARIIRDGEPVALADLRTGEQVRVDLAEAIAVDSNDTVVVAEREPRPVVVRYVTVEPIVLAQADTRDRLPQTASMTPFLLALGGALTVGGLLLRLFGRKTA